jgi:hypothetical protein
MQKKVGGGWQPCRHVRTSLVPLFDGKTDLYDNKTHDAAVNPSFINLVFCRIISQAAYIDLWHSHLHQRPNGGDVLFQGAQSINNNNNHVIDPQW